VLALYKSGRRVELTQNRRRMRDALRKHPSYHLIGTRAPPCWSDSSALSRIFTTFSPTTPSLRGRS
jgi:hypothetical protein